MTLALTDLDVFAPAELKVFGKAPGYSRREYALHIAAKAGHNDIVELLLDSGADIDIFSLSFCACTMRSCLWDLRRLAVSNRMLKPSPKRG